MFITEIQKYDGTDVGIYMVRDDEKTFFVYQYSRGFQLATEEEGYLQKVPGSPDLLSFIEAAKNGNHKTHPLSM